MKITAYVGDLLCVYHNGLLLHIPPTSSDAATNTTSISTSEMAVNTSPVPRGTIQGAFHFEFSFDDYSNVIQQDNVTMNV